MKYRRIVLLAVIALTMLTSTVFVAGCTANGGGFNVSGQENNSENRHLSIYTVEDIKNLVTTDDKLVINYYDAYIWVVFLNKDDSIDRMTYIYKFESEDEAVRMSEPRTAELKKNSSMSVLSSKVVENYVIVELIDSSFSEITGEMLRQNFTSLLVI